MLSKFSTKEKMKEYCYKMVDLMMELKDDNDKLRNTIIEMEKENYKDNKIKALSERLHDLEENYYRGFPISEKRASDIQQWKDHHEISEHNNSSHYQGCSGGGYAYSFYPTAIGTLGICSCSICDEAARQYACLNGTYDRKRYTEYMRTHNGSFEFERFD